MNWFQPECYNQVKKNPNLAPILKITCYYFVFICCWVCQVNNDCWQPVNQQNNIDKNSLLWFDFTHFIMKKQFIKSRYTRLIITSVLTCKLGRTLGLLSGGLNLVTRMTVWTLEHPCRVWRTGPWDCGLWNNHKFINWS